MLFLLSLALAILITVPGMYLVAKTRLAASLLELLSTGFFLGYSILPLAFLGLSQVLPISLIDWLWFVASAICGVFLVRETQRQKLPAWMTPIDRSQATIVSLALLLLTVVIFRELCVEIDDDYFIHLPNIKRISMGDIPPHMPYFPDSVLRGHIARDLFIGTIARFLQLTPELSIIYVSLAICPAYVLVFHSLASRLSGGLRIPTCFCFTGLLLFISGAIGDYSIRAGCMTYAFNNNLFAWPHVVFIAWLIERAVSIFNVKESIDKSFLPLLKSNMGLIGVCILAYAGLYFVYISNFLMISLFLAASPVLAALTANQHKLKSFLTTTRLLAVIVSGTLCLHLLVSPFLLERVLISLSLAKSSEPIGFVQQAHLSFPKEQLFHICCGYASTEYPFLSFDSLKQQGLSFYIGLSGLWIGLATRRSGLAALSLFGWLTYLWMLTVDMGEFRAETLRLLVVSHIAFGGACGLMIGLVVEKLLVKMNSVKPPLQQLLCCTTLLFAGGLCLLLGWGNIEKISKKQSWRIGTFIKKLKAIQRRQAPDWTYLSPADRDMFQLMDRVYIHNFKDRLLAKLPDDPYRQRITSAALTGAGLVGITWEHGAPRMSPELYCYDYRASLFWQRPSLDLLNQLSPNWILVDPATIDKQILADILKFQGILPVFDIKDDSGHRLILIKYKKPQSLPENSASVNCITFQTVSTETRPGALAHVPVKLDVDAPASRVKLALLISDGNGQRVNNKDEPIVGITKEGPYDYTLYFSMLQKGRWRVDIADPQTGQILNTKSLLAEVTSR